MVQGEDNRQMHRCTGWMPPVRTTSAHLHHSHHFTPYALPSSTLPIYPGLGQAPSMLACIRGALYMYTVLLLFNRLFSRTAWVSWHQKGKPFCILMKEEMMGWQWHCWTICKSFAPRFRQMTMPVPHCSVFTGRMLFLPLNQQCQNTEAT